MEPRIKPESLECWLRCFPTELSSGALYCFFMMLFMWLLTQEYRYIVYIVTNLPLLTPLKLFIGLPLLNVIVNYNYCCKTLVLSFKNFILGTNVLKFNLEGIKVYHKLENKISCTKVILNNINAFMIKQNKLVDNNSNAVLFSTPEFSKNSVPFLHGK